MDQLAIDFTTRARRSDPITSRDAARRVATFESEHYRAILRALTEIRSGTIYEISDWTKRVKPHLDHVQVARRCSELARAGKIKRKGELRSANGEIVIHGETRTSGPAMSQCAVWELVP